MHKMETETQTQVTKKFVSLAEKRPDLAKEWNYEKNGNLRPEDVTVNSHKKVWWKLPYDVPMDYEVKKLRGKHFEFEWMAIIHSRQKCSCPFLSGRAVFSGFNDLQTMNPMLAKQWNYVKNKNLKPTQVTANSGLKVWWCLPYDDPITGKHFDFEWTDSIAHRNSGRGCPYLNGQAVWEGFNDLKTINPKLAAQWHPTKNGNLKPTQVTVSTDKKAWWLLPYNDPVTGKHFDFEWKSNIKDRNRNHDCPYLSGNAVWEGFNDLKTINPELAAQWHPTKNGNLKPTQVTANTERKVWWLFSYDDPITRKHFDFEWQASILNRNSGRSNCPYLSGKLVLEGFNDLQTINPELAAQWHPNKNGDLKPIQVSVSTMKKVWWLFPYDDPVTGNHYNFEWQASISSRNNRGTCCPYLSGKKVFTGFNDLSTINPKVASQWHPTKNGNLKPTQVPANSNKKVWWLLIHTDLKTGQHFEFEWKDTINHRNNGRGCPYLNVYNGEEYIKQYLQENGIPFIQQQKFLDLFGVGNGKLSYDFAIPSKQHGLILIEYNGIQHYEATKFFGGDKQFKIQQEHDHRKREYAKNHGYKLISIKYTYDTYDKIAEYLNKHLSKEIGNDILQKSA